MTDPKQYSYDKDKPLISGAQKLIALDITSTAYRTTNDTYII